MRKKKSPEDKVWDEMIRICTRANELIDQGWLLFCRDSSVEKGRFVFSSPFDDECISVHYPGTTCWGTFAIKGKCSCSGSDTLLEEYRAAKRHLLTYRMVPVHTIIKLKHLI